MSYITSQQAAHQLLVTAPTFTDSAQRLPFTTGTGDYGHGAASYSEGASFACSFQLKPVRDAQGATAVPMGDADLFFALDTPLDAADRVTITHLYGIAVDDAQSYDVIAGPFVEHNLKHAELRLVTDEE